MDTIEGLKAKIDAFVAEVDAHGFPNNAWLYEHEPPTEEEEARFKLFPEQDSERPGPGDGVQIYLRVTRHWNLAGTEMVPCIDVSNVIVPQAVQRQGRFTRLLDHIEKSYGRAVRVELVQEPWLVSFYEKRGYKILPDNSGFPNPPSLILEPPR